MAVITKIIVQQILNIDDTKATASKFPRYTVTLGNSISSITASELVSSIEAAAKSAAAAKDSEIAAKTSELNAKNSEQEAAISAEASEASATQSATSATKSAASATKSAESAAAAKTSETNAKTSETKAKTSETNAKTSETNAKTSETKAKASETNAATSEANALASKTAAAASQTAAKISETNAKTSETNAKASELAAANSATNAAASETNALASKNAAAKSQTAAKTSETNAKTSETNAATSETNALASKNAAAGSAADALASKNAAKTSETNAKTSETNAKTSETNAKASEINAKASEAAAAASAASIIIYEPVPYPDVWVPLTDDMRLLSGMAPYDLATINDVTLELPTKSANFTRSTTASYIDKSGKMCFADINEPRFEKQGLLMESQCTNLYTNSEAITGGNLVITTPNASACPTGEMLMTKFTESTSNSEHYCNDKGISLTADTFYCYSAYVKDDTANRLVYLRVASGTTAGMFFDIKNETVVTTGSASNIRGGYERLTGGIYRIWISFAATASQSTIFRLQMAKTTTTAVYEGDGVSGFYIWGIQVEEGIAPTSYIRNSTNTTTTRTADEWWCIPDNAGYRTLADYFERTVSFEFNCKVRPYTSYVEVMQVRGSRYDIICRCDSDDNATIRTYRSSTGPTLAIPDIESLPPMTYAQKIVGNEISNYFNGKTAKSTSTPVSLTGIPSRLGASPSPTPSKFVYHIKNFRVWYRALNNDQINGLR
ncbi:tail fiber protein [Escherichia phage IME178]|uniref:Tail fiber protein n=1 Tax=Escherichia phage IME178 TaxID=2860371 RepID=A0AC61NAR5_9CAUD|nr:tail fiber protein [Escherichia phage IME178]